MATKYEGPIEIGMIFTAPDNDGVLGYRRDKVIGRDPDAPHMLILKTLPCRMRREHGAVHLCPEINLRIVSQPEQP